MGLLLGLTMGLPGSAAPPIPDTAGYRTAVRPLFQDYCLDCHDDATRKGRLSLESIDPDIPGGEHFETWRMIRDQLFFQEMPPRKKSQPADAERAAALAWIRGELLKTQGPGGERDQRLDLPEFGNYVDHEYLFKSRLPFVIPAPPRIWRLRPDIYETVVPRLGERIHGLANGLSQADGSQIKDYASRYFLDEGSTPPLLGNAKIVAESLVAPYSRDQALKRLVDDEGAPNSQQVVTAIETAFRRILGRPPTDEERDRFAGFHEHSTQIGGYRTAGRALITAVLMQPEALYREELGDGTVDAHGRTRLSPREIAYALSFALDNRPRNEFLVAATEGGLATAREIAELVRDNLRDPSHSFDRNPRILQFFREYFHYPHAREVFKDQPDGGQHDASRLVDDLEMTIIAILQKDEHVLAELLTTRDFFVDTAYGRKQQADRLVKRNQERRDKYHTAFNLPVDWKWSPDLQPVRFPKDERAGVLTHPAWLAAWSGNFDNHPVQRGKWIRTHLLGGSVPDVPIGVDARVPEIGHTTFRERLRTATSAAECWRCHKDMDPLGVAFERYDHYGRFQRLDAGQPVDASAEVSRTIVPDLNRTFSGPTEMMDFLARSEFVEQVFVRYVFRYFMGRNETLGDANTLQDAHRAYREHNGSFNELAISLLSSDSFLLRQAHPSK